MHELINLHKKHFFVPDDPNIGAAHKWADAGYGGWPSGRSSPAGDRSNCFPGCPDAYSGSAFLVHWSPWGVF